MTEIKPSDWLRLPGEVGGALASHVHLLPALDGAAHVERDLASLLNNVHNDPEIYLGVIYCVSKKYSPILYSNLLYKMGHNFGHIVLYMVLYNWPTNRT